MRLNFRTCSTVVAGFLLAASALSGIAAERSIGPEPGDVVRVTVYGQPDLTTVARVSSDNTISLPFVGEVQVGGVSTAEAQRNIADALDRQGIVRDPQVTVLVETQGVMSSDFVTILGQVQQPGRYSFGEESELGTRTLLDLLAVAGGSRDEASPRLVLFRNDENGQPTRREISLDELLAGGALQDANLELVPGDVVIVPKTDMFYIYGQVNRPGRYPLDEDMLVMHAISVGGGVTERGNQEGVTLTRRGDGGEHQRRDASLNDVVMPGDVIYVKERFF